MASRGYAADIYMKAIQPRVGVAYKFNEKLIVRGGWGRYYINPTNTYIQSSGFNTSTPLVTSNDGGRTPIPNLHQQSVPIGPVTSGRAPPWAPTLSSART